MWIIVTRMYEIFFFFTTWYSPHFKLFYSKYPLVLCALGIEPTTFSAAKTTRYHRHRTQKKIRRDVSLTNVSALQQKVSQTGLTRGWVYDDRSDTSGWNISWAWGGLERRKRCTSFILLRMHQQPHEKKTVSEPQCGALVCLPLK